MNLAVFSYAMPVLRGRAPYNQVLNMTAFWLMTGGMAFMTFVLTFAGTIQTHMQRVIGDYYMPVQDSLSIFYLMRFGSGLAVVAGALLFIYSMLVVRKREVISPGAAQPVPGE
jgi:nitric oxide reductase subunit B